MSPIVLDAAEQLQLAGIWAMTIAIAYLIGSTRQIDRHIATLERQIAFLRTLSTEPAEDEAA